MYLTKVCIQAESFFLFSVPFKSSIKKALELPALEGEYQIHFCDVAEIVDVLQQKPNCVILFKENRINPNEADIHTWMTDEIEAASTIKRAMP